jgi:hypothetical protein
MTACLCILYWPDFSEERTTHSLYSRPLVAHALRRQLCLRYDEASAYVWDPDGEREGPDSRLGGRSVFQGWGLDPLSNAPEAEHLLALARSHPDSSHVVLAMHPARALPLFPALHSLDCPLEIWSPQTPLRAADLDECRMKDVRILPLWNVLNLATTHSVGLFVDWRHIVAGLERHGLSLPISIIREGLIRTAELVGAVVIARLYGPWEGFPSVEIGGISTSLSLPDPVEAGDARREGEERLRSDLWGLLDDPHAPRTWIVVSDAVWLPNLICRAHGRGIRVLLWPADGEQIHRQVRAEADGFAGLLSVLNLQEGSRDRQTGFAPAAQAERRQRSGHGGETAFVSGMAGLPDSSVSPAARLDAWIRLIYQIQCVLRRNSWSRIALRKLAGELAELEEFGPTSANALMWLNRAKAEGMLLVEQEAHRSDPANRVTICRPNLDHPVCRTAIEVPDRCLRLLRQMLQKMPWVSFKLLRSVLLRDRWLGGLPCDLDETGVDDWLNFLIQEGVLSMTKEPNIENPEYPVTALRLNTEHPLSQGVAAEAAEGARLAAQRAILTIDHFMTRQRKPWMAMSALRRGLDGMSRDEIQTVLEGLQNLGVLIIESYPNPQKEHTTTGCRLNLEEPLVADTLRLRNTIIQTVQYHQRFRSWIALSRVDEDLNEQAVPGDCRSDHLAWFLLLRNEGILELEQDGTVPGAWGSIRCRLNVADAVVRAVVAEDDLGVQAFRRSGVQGSEDGAGGQGPGARLQSACPEGTRSRQEAGGGKHTAAG